MLALSSLPGLSIDTFTSKVVTLSFSTPIGEICVTRPSNTLSLNVSTRDARRLAEPHAADVGLVHLAADEHLARCRRASSPAWRWRRGSGSTTPGCRSRRRASARCARIGALDRGVGEFLLGALDRGAGLRHVRACASVTLRLADRPAAPARRAGGSPPCSSALVRIVERRLRRPASARRALRALVVAAARTRRPATSASTAFFFSCASAPSSAALGGLQVGVEPRARARGKLLLVELGEHVARRRRPDRRRRAASR